jgi:adenylate kinase family enzyme
MIIGICGLIGSGKGTVADILQDDFGFTKLSFADSLKDAVASIFSWDRELLEGATDESRAWREQIDPWWAERLKMPELTPRLILQLWGTEVCRVGFHQDIWIASLERKIEKDRNYVIPDTRFPNETDLIKRISGEIWCVKRGPDPKWFVQYQLGGSPPNHIHSSEWEWARSKFDKTLENNGTLDDLKQSIRSLL